MGALSAGSGAAGFGGVASSGGVCGAVGTLQSEQ